MEEDFATATTDRRINTDLSVLVVVRHAESEAYAKGLWQGQKIDTDLTEFGRMQAQVLAKRLAGRGVTKLYSSPLKRTYQTAQAVSGLSGMETKVDDRLAETNFGIWEGKTSVWIQENYPELVKIYSEKPSNMQFPDGESFVASAGRVIDFLKTESLPPGTVLVTHDTIIRILLCIASGYRIDRMWEFEVEPASVTIFESNIIEGRNVLKVLKVNDVTHLGTLAR